MRMDPFFLLHLLCSFHLYNGASVTPWLTDFKHGNNCYCLTCYWARKFPTWSICSLDGWKRLPFLPQNFRATHPSCSYQLCNAGKLFRLLSINYFNFEIPFLVFGSLGMGDVTPWEVAYVYSNQIFLTLGSANQSVDSECMGHELTLLIWPFPSKRWQRKRARWHVLTTKSGTRKIKLT